ncbi:hypothetical protein ACEN9F_13525 [Duganella sp. CT11-25]|uniref:hypothetical protein n=1 Tax=unclassified Duganella TaxID=2636909 RepID=UPI0039B03AB4
MPTLIAPSPIIRFDPTAPVDLSPLRVGSFTVRRTRVAHTNYIRYSTMLGDDIAGCQISYPDVGDCQRHVSQFQNRNKGTQQRAAMLDTDLHAKIVGVLGTKEMDARDLCRMFSKSSTVMAPVLSMLVLEARIERRGTPRRPLFTVPLAQAHLN